MRRLALHALACMPSLRWPIPCLSVSAASRGRLSVLPALLGGTPLRERGTFCHAFPCAWMSGGPRLGLL